MHKRVFAWAVRRATPVFAALFMACAPAAADGPDISALAPKRSFLVLSIPDWTQLATAFKGSDLGALWENAAVQRFVTLFLEEESKELSEFMSELNIELKELSPPTGQAGIAMYFPEKAPERKPWEPPFPSPHFVVSADFGEHADDWEDVLERLIDHGTKEKQITTEEETFAGVTVRVIKPVYEEVKKEEDPDGEEDAMAWQPEVPAEGLGGLLGGSGRDPRNLYMGRVGSVFIAATELPALEGAIEALGGRASAAIADEQAFRDAAAQRSQRELAYGVFFPPAFLEPLLKAPGDEGSELAAVFGAIGFTDVRAVSVGLRLGTADASAEVSMGVLAPEKKGLLALLAPADAGFEPAGFIPPDAADVMLANVNFAAIPDVVRSMAKTMPEERQQMIVGVLDQFANIINPTFEAMGPGVYYFTTYKQPLDAESEQQTVAIDVKDQAVLTNTISFLLGQAQGMFEPREFEGNTIYASPMIGISAGLGFNRLFFGSEAGVENVMRMAGRAEGGRLGDEPRFRRATQGLGRGGVLYTYADMEQTIRWLYWSQKNQIAIMEKLFDEAGYDEESKQEALKEARAALPKWLDDLPPVETLLEHIRETVSELHATPDGFRGRTLILKPASK
jgi:hypothetical protein